MRSLKKQQTRRKPESEAAIETLAGEKVPAEELSHLHPAIRRFAVRADSLKRDPDNARLHNERNLRAVANSLRKYGQQPLLLSFDPATRVIKVGNGRHEVATDPKWGLNWKWIAAAPSNLSAAELKAFALADNRPFGVTVATRSDRRQVPSGNLSARHSAPALLSQAVGETPSTPPTSAALRC